MSDSEPSEECTELSTFDFGARKTLSLSFNLMGSQVIPMRADHLPGDYHPALDSFASALASRVHRCFHQYDVVNLVGLRGRSFRSVRPWGGVPINEA